MVNTEVLYQVLKGSVASGGEKSTVRSLLRAVTAKRQADEGNLLTGEDRTSFAALFGVDSLLELQKKEVSDG